jgi:hypothetical protein
LVLERVVGHVRQYAEQVPERIQQRLSDVLDELQGSPDKLDAQLDAFRSSATRYADPLWSAGQQAYGESLDASDVLMEWVAINDDATCDDCAELDEGSPYTADDLPTWPAAGDTQCLDRCRCYVTAEADSFNAAMQQEA